MILNGSDRVAVILITCAAATALSIAWFAFGTEIAIMCGVIIVAPIAFSNLFKLK